MKQEVENGINIMPTEQYEAPRMEVIEMEMEDAVLTGAPSFGDGGNAW